jgi:hypothetical protein
MTRTSWLLVGLALLLLAQPVAGPALAQSEEHRVSVDFTDAPLGDVLRAVFRDTPYTFTLGPGLEGLRVTITLSNATFPEALRAIWVLHDLAIGKSGSVYQIGLSGPDPPYARALQHWPVIIYCRRSPTEESTEIVWRAFSPNRGYRPSPEEHVLYTTRGLDRALPIQRGFLPAPDGSCLLVWEMTGSLVGNQTTKWLAVRLLDGAVTELGETPGLPWISALSPLPYWDRWDHHHRLVLAPGSCVFTPDVGSLSGALPGPETPIREASARGPYGDARERLTAYCEQHHRAEGEHLRAALAKPAGEMEVGYLGAEDPTASPHLLLTSLGIPSERSMGRHGWSIFMRHAACSPDGRLLAYADTWVHELLPGPEDQAPTGYGLGARLDVFDVATGQRLWYARRASVPRWIPAMYESAQPSGRSTYTRFADLRWSRDGRYLSFTTCEGIYSTSQTSYSVTVLDVTELRLRPVVLHLSNGSNAFVITPPAAETAERP